MELRKPYLFIVFQAAAFSFPMNNYGFKTRIFYRVNLPAINHGSENQKIEIFLFFVVSFWFS